MHIDFYQRFHFIVIHVQWLLKDTDTHKGHFLMHQPIKWQYIKDNGSVDKMIRPSVLI